MGPGLACEQPGREEASATLPVLLHGGDEASGLADMLHQYLEQTLGEEPAKAKAARALRGEVAFRAAEDETVCVRVRFTGEAVELSDGSPEGGVASVTGDLVTVAHLATGRESPIGLVARRRLRVRFRARDVPFLIRFLWLMRTGAQPAAAQLAPRPRWRGWAWLAAAAAVAAMIGLSWCAAAG